MIPADQYDDNGNGKVHDWPPEVRFYRDRTDHVGAPILNDDGVWVCRDCERPTTRLGLATDNKRLDGQGTKACSTCFGGMLHFPDMTDPVTKRIVVSRRKPVEKRKKLTELLRDKAHERAEKILQPYFDILEMEPVEEWSPRTKLDFKQGQVAVAEKLLNRLEGLPTQRIRNVDAEDNDVVPQISGLPSAVQERALLGLFTKAPELAAAVRADIEADAVEVPNEEDRDVQ